MRMKLHLDTKIGETVILPIYEIDYETATETTGFNEIGNGVFGDGSKHNRFRCTNANAGITDFISANVPRIMTDNNKECVFPYRLRYTAQIGGYYYPVTWLDDDAFTQLQTQPSDWWTSCKYLKYQITENARYIYKPHDIGNTSGTIDTFTANQCYTDNNRSFIRKYVTESGAYFVCGQGYAYGGYGQYAIIYPLCMGIGSRMSLASTSPSTEFFFHDTQNHSADIGIQYSGLNTRENPPYSDGYPLTPIFVHYTKNNENYYGVALIRWTSFENDAFPIEITVTGITNPFWGDSIISGGESGAGVWGNNAIPTINDGTFTSVSDSVTTTDPNHSTTAIQTKVNDALSGLFASLTGVYNIYMLATLSGGSMSFTELTRIYNVLYADGDNQFLTRYLQSMYNPLSAVVAMHLLPYQFAASALFIPVTTKKLTVSGYDVSARIDPNNPPEYPILKPLGRVVFPAVDIPRVFGGYADFAPYTQCILHLPFIGAIELKTNAIAHGSITVEYLCDIVSGNVTARVSCTDNTGENTQYVHTASGNCAYNLPLFSMNQNGDAVGKMLSGGAGIVSGALTGNPVNVATGAAGVVGAAIESSFSPRSTQISGNLGGNSMLMSNLDVWLEIVRPVWVENMHYQKLYGIPADMSNCIADCGQTENAGVAYDGFLQIDTIDLDNVPCTEQEKQEIETLLKQGVFIRGAEI